MVGACLSYARVGCALRARLWACWPRAGRQSPLARSCGSSIGGGRVTLIADDAATGQRFGRVGARRGDAIHGGGAIEAARVSLHLVDVDEAQALRWVLRPAAGYVATWRARSDPGSIAL